MTEAELAALLAEHPVLYHMAERGSWPCIRRHGLLSTSALLDLFGVHGDARARIEAVRRDRGVPLAREGLGRAVIRDQLPMTDAGLRRCLADGMEPADWYRLLNGKAFFWLSRERLLRLLGARQNRALEHEVLELDAAALVRAYADAVTLSPINSGSTIRRPAPRGRATFLPIRDYPWAGGRRGERAVELAVEGGVPDLRRFVRRVVTMRGAEVRAVLYAGDGRARPAPAPPPAAPSPPPGRRRPPPPRSGRGRRA